MDPDTDTKMVDWYLIFSHSKGSHWLFKYLMPGFSHVKAVRLSDEGYMWIVVDPKAAVTEINLYPVSLYPHISTLCGHSDIILPVRAKIKENYRGGFCWFNCVEVVKSLLGIKAMLCWTPWQLYRRLTDE